MTITPDDQQEIIDEINKSYNNLNPLIRGFMPPIPSLLKQIPAVARQYTLGELIEFLEKAHEEKKIP
jgi:hypothetical protein